jgi:glutamate racemase
VTQQACPKLVPIVEDGKADAPEALAAIREYVGPLLTEGGVVTPVGGRRPGRFRDREPATGK